MAEFVTSDMHLNHQRIIEADHQNRPFSSVEEMNDRIISNWNGMVGIMDTVFIVGDAFMGPRSEWPALCARLNGYKILVMGNHDGKREWSHEKNIELMYSVGFDEVHDDFYKTYENKVYWMNHYPVQKNELVVGAFFDKRDLHRPKNTQPYDCALSGHTHDSRAIYGPGMIHVGMDAHNFEVIPFWKVAQLYYESLETSC